jgi:tape measure domain-containing protein
LADGIDIQLNDKIAASIATKIKEIGSAAKSSYNAVEKLKTSLQGFNAVNNVFNNTASSAQKLATTINKSNSAIGSLKGNVTQLNNGLGKTATTANQVANNLKKVQAASTSTAKSFGTFSSAGRTLYTNLVALVGIRAFVGLANDADNLNNKLINVAKSSANFTELQGAMFDAANRTRTSVDSFTDAYVRYNKALIPLGANQATVLKFTETLSKAFIASGKTTEEASAGVIQLGQALQSGRLQGDEFRSVMENMPVEVIQALAEQLGVNVSQLKKLSTQGKITSDVILKAILGLSDTIDVKFNRTVLTVGQSFAILRNKAEEFFTSNTAPARILSSVILALANNMQIVIPLIVAFGTAWALVNFVGLLQDVKLLALGIVQLSGTLIPFIAGLLGGLAALYATGAAVATLIGKQDEYNDALGTGIANIVKIGQEITDLTKKSLGFDQLTTSMDSLDGATNNLVGSTATLNQNFTQLGHTGSGVYSVTDAMSALDQVSQRNVAASGKLNDNLKQTGVNAESAAGSLRSLGGTYNGVIDVNKALEGTSSALKYVAGDGKTAVSAVTSLGGTSNGVYQLSSAVKQLNSDLNNTATAADKAARAIKAAASIAGGALRDMAVNSPSFTTIKPPSSTVNSPSFTSLGPSGSKMTVLNPTSSVGAVQHLGAYANGGSMIIGGRGGVDRNRIAMDVSRGERVDVSTPAQQRAANRNNGPTIVNRNVMLTVNTPNADSFRRSRRQLAADLTAIQNA